MQFTAPAQDRQPDSLNICTFSIQNLLHQWMSNRMARQMDVYFKEVNIQDNFKQDRKERERGKNINNLVLPLLI